MLLGSIIAKVYLLITQEQIKRPPIYDAAYIEPYRVLGKGQRKQLEEQGIHVLATYDYPTSTKWDNGTKPIGTRRPKRAPEGERERLGLHSGLKMDNKGIKEEGEPVVRYVLKYRTPEAPVKLGIISAEEMLQLMSKKEKDDWVVAQLQGMDISSAADGAAGGAGQGQQEGSPNNFKSETQLMDEDDRSELDSDQDGSDEEDPDDLWTGRNEAIYNAMYPPNLDREGMFEYWDEHQAEFGNCEWQFIIHLRLTADDVEERECGCWVVEGTELGDLHWREEKGKWRVVECDGRVKEGGGGGGGGVGDVEVEDI